MKVSRKVGRRSRKHTSSSVSRRRLRNKNKKHTKTQKGGKYVKRGRGHKRARTHKRGKRFHRGGFNCNNIALMPLYRLRDGSMPQSDMSRKYFSIDTPEIHYTKVGSKIQNGEISEFTSSKVRWKSHQVFTMYVDFIITGDKVDLVIVFIRDPLDDKSPTFVFEKQGTTGEIKDFLKNMAIKLTDKDQLESDKKYRLTQDNNNILETKFNPGSPRRVYSFKSPENVETFTKIADCIKSKIPGVVDATIPSHLVHDDTAPAPATATATDGGYTDDDYSTQGWGFPEPT
jgi:hypothetical protein